MGSCARRQTRPRILRSGIVTDPPLAIRLFGQFQVHRGGAPMHLDSARGESLLAFLLLHRHQSLQRQRLAFALWPDSTEAQALTNLRHVLHNLRRSWPEIDRHLEVTQRTLSWRPDPPYRLDVAEFEAALSRGSWDVAVRLYTGDLLVGRADEWVEGERARLRHAFVEALERLVATAHERGDLTGAVRYAERLLREQPMREETYRLLMRLHDAQGDRTSAVRVYHECAATLERELGIEPAAVTRAVYDALLSPDDVQQISRVGGTSFVGRSAERATLTARWRQARTAAQVVLLAGEPGIGKTRLAEEFRAWCAHRGAVTAVARAYPGEGALAYGPVVAWLRSERLNAGLRALAAPYLTELARLLPELLATVPRPLRLPESEQRQRLYDAVVQALLASGAPVLLVADDVQWWDREALRLLHYVVRTRPSAPLLVVATARREDIETATPVGELLNALRLAERVTEIDLDRLNRSETAVLAEQLSGKRFADADIAALYRQTEGNPLFIVEALRAGDVLTPKVQAVVQARVAQLSAAARELVDVAATVGREFTAEVLALAGQVSEDVVIRGLDELWRRRIIREHDTRAYDFSHDTIREAVYAELSPVRRRYLHGRVARALEAAYQQDPGSVSGRLARHYEEAERIEQAVAAYAHAAEVAQQLYAHAESARHLTRALELVRSLPESRRRWTCELDLSNALLAPLVASEGYASARIHETHRRALKLCRSLGAEPSPPLLRSLGLGSLALGDFAAAREHGTALRDRGQREDDDVLRVEGDYVLGVTAFWAGELTAARKHLERAVATYRDENRREHLLRYAQDPLVICLTRLALTYWFLGDEQAAIRARDRGLARAEEIAHPYSLMTTLLFASLLALDMGEVSALRRFVQRGKAVAPPVAGEQIDAAIAALAAYLEVVDGRPAEGIARIRRIVAAARVREQAAPGLRSALLRILLAACDVAGDPDTGLQVADELSTLTSSVIWRPEAERLRAKFLARQHPAST
ncbi:transcriptional regulator [Prauserella endophytica]|uniref:Transcriptional regulator n=2 Tax=Prauserella endophytica TaxID=1592324 RepID=A0ABY2S988_9PSEU|nr:transcriptional regulator [Prauserella endophytica]